MVKPTQLTPPANVIGLVHPATKILPTLSKLAVQTATAAAAPRGAKALSEFVSCNRLLAPFAEYASCCAREESVSDEVGNDKAEKGVMAQIATERYLIVSC